MSLTRHPDWQLRLETFARERRALPFAWGSNDCVLFAADAVQALTGVRLCPELRGHASVRDGLAIMRRLGGVRAIATRALGEPVAPAFARVGDVVAFATGKREGLGICNGFTIIAPGPDGIGAVPLQHAVAAWRVG